jgi:hypothetical protein
MSDDRAAEGLEHLQAAALEMIAAARAFLDVAEDLVSDPDRVAGTLASLATLVDLAARPRRTAAERDDAPDEPAGSAGPDGATVGHDPLAGATFGDGSPLRPPPMAGDAATPGGGGRAPAARSRIRRIDVS